MFQSTLPRGERHTLIILYCVLSCFNPRSRVGSDGVSSIGNFILGQFQSTLPRGERQNRIIMTTIKKGFNPRSRVGSDSVKLYDIIYEAGVQSTLPRGERRARERIGNDITMFQSTLPRGERPDYIATADKSTWVSIHAPAWGATRRVERTISGQSSFNPRSRVGSDG